MAQKKGTLGRIASKTVAAGRAHMAKVILGEETLPEAAGGTVEDLLSGKKSAKSSSETTSKKSSAKMKTSVQKKRSAKSRPRSQKK